MTLDDDKLPVKRFKIQYPASAYTFPGDAIISTVRFDDEFVHVELTDGRIISVPVSYTHLDVYKRQMWMPRAASFR